MILRGGLRRTFQWLILGGSLAGLLVCRPLNQFSSLDSDESHWLGQSDFWVESSSLRTQCANPATTTLKELKAAIRPTEGRLSGDFSYALFPTLPKGSTIAEIAAIVRALRSRRDALMPFNLDLLAHLELAAGRSQEAARLLARAFQEIPNNTSLLNDLAVVALEEGTKSGRAQRFLDAFDLATRAVSFKPRCAEAWFNRALVLEHLFLPSAAALDWQRYLALDPNSRWAGEARQHLEKLRLAEANGTGSIKTTKSTQEAEWTTDDSQKVREKIEDDLLPSWAEAVERGDGDEAKRALSEALALADTLVEAGADSLAQDVVSQIAQTGRGGERWRRLARGHLLLGHGRFDLKAHRINKAYAELKEASATLADVASPAVVLARLQVATALYQANLNATALSELSRLAKDPSLSHYPIFRARVKWMLGLTELRLGNPGIAVNAYESALELVHAQHEAKSSAALESLLAESLDVAGRPIEAWDHRYQALAWSAGQLPSTRVYNIFDDTVLALALQGHFDLALLFQERLLLVTAALGHREETALTLLRGARILVRLDRNNEANTELEKAIGNLKWITDPPTRQRIISEADLVRSEITGKSDPSTAIASLSRVIAFRPQPEFLRARAELFIREGDLSAAEKDLSRAIDSVENRRKTFGATSDRIPVLDQAAGMFSSLLSIQLRSDKADAGFLTTERARAHALLDRLHMGAFTKAPTSSLALFACLPRNTVVADFAVVDGRLVTWIGDRFGLRSVLRGPPFERVENLVHGLRDALSQNDDSRVLSHLRWLHEVLVSPWKATIKNSDALVFVPVGVLQEVPFAALFDSKVRRFLVQDHSSAVAASVAAYVEALEVARLLARMPIRQALVIGSPSLIDDLASLPSLPGAAEEAVAIATLYPKAELLEHTAATRRRFLAALAKSDIVHLALHAQGSEDALGSRLLLAPEGDDRGTLTASEVFEMSLRRPRLVVLAGCATAVGRLSASEGALSLAYAFQAAGVPSLVGSLWDVRDRESSQILISFHRYLQKGGSPMEALRQAQIEDLALHPVGHWDWAGFELIGAGTNTAPAS